MTFPIDVSSVLERRFLSAGPTVSMPHVLGIPASYFAGVSRLFSVTSLDPKLVSVSGCSASVLQGFDENEQFIYGVQYPFQFDAFSLPTLMHQSDANVFGTVDFYSQLKYLIVALGWNPRPPMDYPGA